MTKDSDIGLKQIYDKDGKVLGNIVGRKSEIERFSNHDLANQLKSDRKKHQENLQRK